MPHETNHPRSGSPTAKDAKIIAFVTETPSVRAILAHIGKPTRPPALAPARAPPWEEAPVKFEPDYDLLAQLGRRWNSISASSASSLPRQRVQQATA